MEMQTDVLATKNQRIQTPMPVLVDAEAQSEEVIHPPTECQTHKNIPQTLLDYLGEQRLGKDSWFKTARGAKTTEASLQPVQVTGN
jgi:hypothetical protein